MIPGTRKSKTNGIDQHLIERFLKGDDTAFDALVLRHSPSIRCLLFRLIGNREDAEDMAQETFIRVYQHLPKFRGRSSFKTWIARIAVNLAMDHLRKQKRNPSDLSLGPTILKRIPGGKSETPQAKLDMEEKSGALDKALAQLPMKQRTALVLKVTEGMNYLQIAQVMGSTESAVKANVHLARKRMLALVGDLL